MTITLGCDPEFFIVDRDGNLKSSVPLIKGTKEIPLQVNPDVYVMQDNVAIEFGMSPARTEQEWVRKIKDAYKTVEGLLPPGYRLLVIPSAEFPDTELQTPESRLFGCDPDYNAWTKKRNNPPPDAGSQNLRSCGGHVHVGEAGINSNILKHHMGKMNAVRLLDATVGIQSVVLDNSDAAKRRRELYGKAGCHRPKPYGIEYRTLSNFWVASERLTRWLHKTTSYVIRKLSSDYDKMARFVGYNGDVIQQIINNGEEDNANIWCKTELRSLLPRSVYDQFTLAMEEKTK